MRIQYITYHQGFTIGVFIPIADWEVLQSKLPDTIKAEEELPQWQRTCCMSGWQKLQHIRSR